MQESYKIPTITNPEVEGDIASFRSEYPLPLKSGKFYLEAYQDGTGTPSPTNVRAIHGYSGIDIYKCGGNLWDEEWELGILNTVDGSNQPSNSQIRSKNYIPVMGNNSYYIVLPVSRLYVFWYDVDKTLISYTTGIANTTTKSPENAKFARFYCNAPYGTTYNNDISFNYPSSDTDYHTYDTNSNEYIINLGDEYYGGYYDSVTGLFWVTSTIVDLDDFTFELVSNVESPYYRTQLTEGYKYISSLANTMCNKYSAKAIGVTGTDEGYFITSTSQLRVRDLSITSPSDLNGTKVCYELATPYTIQLAPVPIETIDGQNNIFCNTGNTSLKYIKVN